MKNYLKFGFSLLLFVTILTSCEENNVVFTEEIKQETFKTVSKSEVKHFLESKQNSSLFTKSNNLNISWNLDQLTYENLLNSNELLAVVPATTTLEGHYSRVLLLKINDEIKSSHLAIYPNEDSDATNFSGELMITDLDGNFITGYRVENNVYISQFVKRSNENKNSNNTKSGELDSCYVHGECANAPIECIICFSVALDEVVLSVPKDDFPIVEAIVEAGNGGGITEEAPWDSGGGGENFSDPETTDECSDGYVKDENDNCVAIIAPPDCESFNFSKVGTTDWQTAAVSGINETFQAFNWSGLLNWSDDLMIEVTGIFTQPLYFQLPINSTIPNGGRAATLSAQALHKEFQRFDSYYFGHYDESFDALEIVLLDFMKQEMSFHGGTVTTTPPFGFNGIITPYIKRKYGTGNCG